MPGTLVRHPADLAVFLLQGFCVFQISANITTSLDGKPKQAHPSGYGQGDRMKIEIPAFDQGSEQRNRLPLAGEQRVSFLAVHPLHKHVGYDHDRLVLRFRFAARSERHILNIY